MNLNRDALIALRERSGMNKQQLADAAGVDRTLVTRIEKGERNATPSVITKLALALKVPVTAILGPAPDTEQTPAEASV
jgi:transcriptional regulator with XRE-family HTH domain